MALAKVSSLSKKQHCSLSVPEAEIHEEKVCMCWHFNCSILFYVFACLLDTIMQIELWCKQAPEKCSVTNY